MFYYDGVETKNRNFVGFKYNRKEETVKFKCRLCGHEKYEPKFGDTSLSTIGGRIYPVSYICCGCSVVFDDISKFSIEKI